MILKECPKTKRLSVTDRDICYKTIFENEYIEKLSVKYDRMENNDMSQLIKILNKKKKPIIKFDLEINGVRGKNVPLERMINDLCEHLKVNNNLISLGLDIKVKNMKINFDFLRNDRLRKLSIRSVDDEFIKILSVP